MQQTTNKQTQHTLGNFSPASESYRMRQVFLFLVFFCIFRFFRFFWFSEVFRGLGGSQRLQGRPPIHIPSQDIDLSSKDQVLKYRIFYEISTFDMNRLLNHKLIIGISKVGICVKIVSYYTY